MENKEEFKIEQVNARVISPNYFITEINQDKFTKGAFFGDKVLFGKTFNQDLDGKIIVYEDRVNGWFLNHAKNLLKDKDADFIVLMICTSYLEGNQQFKEGKSSNNDSGETVKRALKSIFSFPKGYEWAIDKFVSEVRHGLFHDGMTRNFISLNRSIHGPISMKDEFGGMIIINPILFFWAIEENFKDYINNLKNPNNKELRENFEKHWNERYNLKVEKDVIKKD